MKRALLTVATALLAIGTVTAAAPDLGADAQRKAGQALYG